MGGSEGAARLQSRYVLLAAVEVADFAAFLRVEPVLPQGTYHVAPVNARRERMHRMWVELVRHAKKLRRLGRRGAARAESRAESLGEQLRYEPLGFRGAFGFVGEGPHVVAIGPDGSLLAVIDGPLSPGRAKVLTSALDGALPPSGN